MWPEMRASVSCYAQHLPIITCMHSGQKPQVSRVLVFSLGKTISFVLLSSVQAAGLAQREINLLLIIEAGALTLITILSNHLLKANAGVGGIAHPKRFIDRPKIW